MSTYRAPALLIPPPLRSALLAGLLLVAAGCGTGSTLEPPRSVPLGAAFALRVGGSAEISGESLVIEFERVVEDARCPQEVTCVWEGNARIRLGVRREGDLPREVEVNTAVQPRAARELGFRVTLERLEPEPPPQGMVPQSRYTAHLRVERGS